MKHLVLTVASIALLLVTMAVILLPAHAPEGRPRDFPLRWPVAKGAYHVHSERSDGTGTLDNIAAAAARAGLQFVIVTDHGDGTRPPEPPRYRSGVLVLDGVEISTSQGHYVALGIPQAPYPLAGHPRDVIEDVQRLGGFGFVAHPGSPKRALQWDDWDAEFDGLEWLNADSEWRDEFWGALGATLLTYTMRPVETLAGLLDRPDAVLRQWDRAAARRRVTGIAGADAHARLGLRSSTDPYDDYVIARMPGYEVSFRTFVNHAILDAPLTRDPVVDAGLVLGALREGRLFTSIDGLAGFTALDVQAFSGTTVARPGEYLDATGPVTIQARLSGPQGTRLAVLRDGAVLYETRESALRLDIGEMPGAYRLEAYLPESVAPSSVPWVLTNPIYVGMRDAHARAAATAPSDATSRSPIAADAAQAEASAGSHSALTPTRLEDGTPAIAWRFALAAGTRHSQFAAMRFPVGTGLALYDRVQLRARSDAPRRVWAQLRVPGPQGGERWGRTFYVDESLGTVDLRFEDFRPLGAASSERPPLERVDSLLLVIDTLNTRPGGSGLIAITDLWLAR